MFPSTANLIYYTVWVIAECDVGITDYYGWQYWNRTHIKLMRPKHGAHISVVRGKEEGIKPGRWKRNVNGSMVTFNYDPEIRENEEYVWLRVWSDDLTRIRTELNLDPEPPFGYHLTIGRKQ